MLRENGGVIDDLIVYYMSDQWYRMVVNAGTRDKDLEWLRQVAAGYGVTVEPRTELAMIAVQGPNARAKAASVMEPAIAARALEIGPFFGLDAGNLFIARTGYTGEDGLKSCCLRNTPSRCGRVCALRVSHRADSARATRCASRPA